MKLSFENALDSAKKSLASSELDYEKLCWREMLKNVLKDISQLEKDTVKDRSKAELYYEDERDVYLDGKVAGLKEARKVIERYLEKGDGNHEQCGNRERNQERNRILPKAFTGDT